MIKLHLIDVILQFFVMLLSSLWWIQGVWKKNSKFQIFKAMKSTSKTIFNHYILTNTFNDKFWRSQFDILYLSTKHNNRGQHEK